MDNKLLEQLAARAAQRERDRLAVRKFPVGGIEMDFKRPDSAAQLAYYEALSEAKGARELIELCTELIYDCCEDLRDPALHQALGVVDPYDAVRKLLDMAEIDKLGGALLGWMGLLAAPADTAGGAPSTQAEETAKN